MVSSIHQALKRQTRVVTLTLTTKHNVSRVVSINGHRTTEKVSS
tara:strand:- start:47489 stop:47620 length:132 start_codon:yes stop_codon:yes gene_type:complete